MRYVRPLQVARKSRKKVKDECPLSTLYMYLEKRYVTCCMLLALLLVLAACGPTINHLPQSQNVTFDKAFQNQAQLAPPPPTYRCGAWASNNAPGIYSTIVIYARLTKNVIGVSKARASGIVHFASGDTVLDQQPVSDSGGYVSFPLVLQGRQPGGVPATVDINFYVGDQTVQCSQAFFTPQ